MKALSSDDLARRMAEAVAAGQMSGARGSCQVVIDLGAGDSVVIFNDAGSADYSETIVVGGTTYQYGTHFASVCNQDDMPIDPLDLVPKEIFDKIDALCVETF